MKKQHKFLLITLLSAFTFSGVFAQTSEIETVKGGIFKNQKVYKKCDIELTNPQLIALVKNDEQLKDYYKPMALNYAASTLLYSSSTLLILWPVTESLYANTDPNWNLAYIGAGCALLSIPFKKAFNKHADRAVAFYNSGYKKTSNVDFDFNIGPTGIGIVMNF
jgi:hypothetical protein